MRTAYDAQPVPVFTSQTNPPALLAGNTLPTPALPTGARSRWCSMCTQSLTWAQRIGGGALVLALVGLSAPSTTNARFAQDETPIEDPTGEEIEIFDTLPSPTPQPTIAPFNTGTHTGGGAPNTTSGGGSGGGGPVTSGGNATIHGGYGLVTLEEMMDWCTRDGEDDRFMCNLAVAAFTCEYDLGGSFYEVLDVELDTNENEVDGRIVGRCDVLTEHGWMQVWYHDLTNGSAEPTEICSGAPGQPGTCFEP